MLLASQPAHYDPWQYFLAYGLIIGLGLAMLIWMRSAGVAIHRILLCAFLIFTCFPLSLILMIKYVNEARSSSSQE